MKLKLPMDVTNILSVKETSGMAKLLMLKIAMSAVYEEPPPKPTDE